MKQEDIRMITYRNPILPGFHPDPSVCRVGENYYLVNSTFAYFPGVPIYESKDLVHWRQIGNVLERNDNLPLGECGHSHGIYAPTIRFHKGVYYMITTNIGNRGNFVVTAENPAGPWSEPHWIDEAYGIDPSLFFDDDGTCYYCGTKGDPNERYFGDNIIYIRELNLNTFQLTGPEYVAWKGALRDCVWPEGPHIYKRNGYYYVLNAEGGTGPDHAVVVARSRNIAGPYEGCKWNPVLTHRHMGGAYPVYAVGHADLVEDENGNWYAVMLAMRKVEGYTNTGRETFLATVTWENDWPVFNAGEGKLLEEGKLPLAEYRYEEGELAGWEEDASLHFDTACLPKKVMTIHNPEKTMYRIEDGKLYLRCGVHTISETKPVSYLCIRQTGMNATMQTTFVFEPEEGEEAGLVLLQSNDAHLRVTMLRKAGACMVQAVKTEGGVEELLGSAPCNVKELRVRMIQKGQSFTFVAEAVNGEALLAGDLNTIFLSTELAGGFVGCTVGVYATANGRETEHTAVFSELLYCNCP